MPLVVLEAMACSVPVVAMDVGGVVEVIEVDTTGVLGPPGNSELLAELGYSLLLRPRQLRAMGQAGRRRIEEQFRVQTSMQRTGEILRQLAAASVGMRL